MVNLVRRVDPAAISCRRRDRGVAGSQCLHLDRLWWINDNLDDPTDGGDLHRAAVIDDFIDVDGDDQGPDPTYAGCDRRVGRLLGRVGGGAGLG